MFGYVLPPSDLPEEERERFRRMYCGLCRVLGNRYGAAARWTLNFDFTYLAILLSDRVEDSANGGFTEVGPGSGGSSGECPGSGGSSGECPDADAFSHEESKTVWSAQEGFTRREGMIKTGRCPIHPLRPRAYRASTPALELAADESIILAWWQLQDAAEDRAFSLPERGAAAALRSAYRRAAEYRPAFDGAVRRQLDILHGLERENCPSLDRPADAFASLLRQAAEGAGHPVKRRILEQIFYHLGRWIYLIDAADDLKRDAKSGDYNPAAARFHLTDGTWTPEARREFASTLDQSVRAMAAAFELWDFGPWETVLRETIYRGLFQVGRSVLDGTFRRVRMPWR